MVALRWRNLSWDRPWARMRLGNSVGICEVSEGLESSVGDDKKAIGCVSS
jgi:hypothetical protein